MRYCWEHYPNKNIATLHVADAELFEYNESYGSARLFGLDTLTERETALVRALHALPGVVKASCKRYECRIEKGVAYRWDEIRDPVRALVRDFVHGAGHDQPADVEVTGDVAPLDSYGPATYFDSVSPSSAVVSAPSVTQGLFDLRPRDEEMARSFGPVDPTDHADPVPTPVDQLLPPFSVLLGGKPALTAEEEFFFGKRKPPESEAPQ